MEWNKQKDQFEKSLPTPSPTISVKVSMLKEVHAKCGINCKGEFSAEAVDAVTDTGAQTTSAGVGILKDLGINENMLVPTRHKIVGITDTPIGRHWCSVRSNPLQRCNNKADDPRLKKLIWTVSVRRCMQRLGNCTS